MIRYPFFDFASAPRTGCGWFVEAARLAGLGNAKIEDAHIPHSNGRSDTLRVSLVRDPHSWLSSYYASLPEVDLEPLTALRKIVVRSLTFDGFVRSYLFQTPGCIGRVVEAYNADIVLRIEDMPWAFVNLVESFDVPEKMWRRCLLLPPANVSKYKPAWNASLKSRVRSAEDPTFERFDY